MKNTSRCNGFLHSMSSVAALAAFAVVSYIDVYALVSAAFFEQTRMGGFGLSFLILIMLAISVALTLFFGVKLYLRIYKKDVSGNAVVILVAEICSVLLLLATIAVNVFGGTSTVGGYFTLAPYFVTGLAAVAFLMLMPLAAKKLYMGMIAVCLSVAIIGIVSVVSVDLREFSFESAPAVFDNGADFSVVWCTTAKSIGYLEYTYNDQQYIVYDAADGKYRADTRVHTVHVPYAHLYGNSYSVSAAKVIRNTPYTSKIGEFIKSPTYTFANKIDSDKMSVIAASDWHEDTGSLISAVAACKNFDVLLMMGDPANCLDEFDDIINYVVVPAGKTTGGTKPVLYVRGNHEPRGRYADQLKGVLGYENFYYTASYGSQNFFVFDGGEDKYDAHKEYGGLIVSEPYRAEELEYMNSLPVMGGYNICLCHMPLYTISGDNEGYALFRSILEKQDIKFEISGHEHALNMIAGDSYTTLIDGGPINHGEQYVVCYISISRGLANVEAINSKGEKVQSYSPVVLK